MSEVWTLEEIAAKADWEGGLMQLVQWGLRSEDVPPELRPEWKKLEAAVKVMDKIQRMLPDPDEDDDDY